MINNKYDEVVDWFLQKKYSKGSKPIEKYCQHTGWWVRMLQRSAPCPACGKYLDPKFR